MGIGMVVGMCAGDGHLLDQPTMTLLLAERLDPCNLRVNNLHLGGRQIDLLVDFQSYQAR